MPAAPAPISIYGGFAMVNNIVPIPGYVHLYRSMLRFYDMPSAELKEKVRRLEEEKAEIEAETAELNQYKGYVGLDDATIRRCVENVAKVDIDTPEGLKLILSVVSRVNIRTDTIEIKTLISTDGTDPDPTKSRPQHPELFPSESASGEKYHTTPENGSGHHYQQTRTWSCMRAGSGLFFV